MTRPTRSLMLCLRRIVPAVVSPLSSSCFILRCLLSMYRIWIQGWVYIPLPWRLLRHFVLLACFLLTHPHLLACLFVSWISWMMAHGPSPASSLSFSCLSFRACFVISHHLPLFVSLLSFTVQHYRPCPSVFMSSLIPEPSYDLFSLSS